METRIVRAFALLVVVVVVVVVVFYVNPIQRVKFQSMYINRYYRLV